MATKKRTGLGKGISSLIPTAPAQERDVDVFFDGGGPTGRRSVGGAASQSPARNEATDASAEGTPADVSGAESSSDRGARDRAATSTTGTRKSSSRGSVARGSTNKKTATKPATSKRTAAAGGRASETSSPATSPRTASGSGHGDETGSNGAKALDATFESALSASMDTDAASVATNVASTDADAVENLVPVPGATLAHLDPARIVPNAWQPRHEFDQDALDELIVSVREFGVLQPIVVRSLATDDPRRSEGEFELIMGERRLRASKAAHRETIPAIIRETEDEAMLRDALLENLHRAELNPLEEASAYRQLLDDFGITQEELAERIGRSRPRISNTLRLLNLPVEVQRKVAAGVLSAGHARAVLSVGEPAAMTQLADKIINDDLSVREAEAAAAKSSSRAGRAPVATKSGDDTRETLAAHLSDIGERLGDRLSTRVNVTLRKTKGQIVIDFASVADLHRILDELGEGDAEQESAGA